MRGGVRDSAATALLPGGASADSADIGGWMAERQNAAAEPATPGEADACLQVLQRAAAGPAAANAYHAALCHLQAGPAGPVAAMAWLTGSAHQQYLPADRLRGALQAADAGAHRPTPYCRDLGHGQRICHGGVRLAASSP